MGGAALEWKVRCTVYGVCDKGRGYVSAREKVELW